MLRDCASVAIFSTLAVIIPLALAEDTGVRPPPYRGVNTSVAGVFVTPVPGVPFSAVVKLESTQVMPDGTSVTKKSIATVARDSSGRIYNERRQLLPSSFTGIPRVLSGHIFEPETRLSTFLDPRTHLARQSTLPERPARTGAAGPAVDPPDNPFFKQEDLGENVTENIPVHGVRQTRTIPAAATGAGKDIVVTDEYWYCDELHMNILTKHNDPRTGTQVVTITQVNRNEPDPAMFQVPEGYKVIDENPAN